MHCRCKTDRVDSDRAFVGRHRELLVVDELCEQVRRRGSAILIEGDPGVGKTALADACEQRAAARGMRVLRASGVLAEAAAPYSGLHLLLQPLFGGLSELPPPQREALHTAFGIQQGSPPPPFLVGLAALSLLSAAAQNQPLLVIGEDLHWFDPASRSALLIVARRTEPSPILVVMTARNDADRLDVDGIRRLPLTPLSFIEANTVLDNLADSPGGAARRLLLEMAAGNPLALVELTPSDVLSGGPDVVPLTRRLERAFAGRYAELPRPTRLIVLAAALGGNESTHEAVAAAACVLDGQPEGEWLSPAATVGLIEISPSRIHFRHPLVRSAVMNTSDAADRTAILGALVRVVAEKERTVWWRCELAVGADPALADELDRYAIAGLAAGDPTLATRALRRAVDLTIDPGTRDDRLVRAADAAAQAGAYEVAAELLQRAAADIRDPGSRARAQWIRELLPSEESALARGDLRPALDAIDAMRRAGQTDTALNALLLLASVAWHHSTAAHPGADLAQVASGFALGRDDPRMLLLAAVTQPADRADELIARILRLPDTDPDDAEAAWYLGYALNLSGEVVGAADHLRRSVDGFRRQGHIALLPHALLGLAWICYLQGSFAEGRGCIDECLGIAVDLNDGGLAAAARTALAWYDATDGVVPDRSAIAAASRLAPQALNARDHQATLAFAEGMAANVAGRPRDAQSVLLRLADPGDPAYKAVFRIISLPDLVEAALSVGDHALARAQFDEVSDITRGWHAQAVDSALSLASIMLSDDRVLTEVAADLEQRPLPVGLFGARAHLHLGSRLRRTRRIEAGRRHLHHALQAFESFPAPAWAQRCRAELRASGERLPGAQPADRHVLTPQELRIGELAAAGLSNRQIAEQLVLSPRTIGAHLHSAFRKLGITSRGQLAEVLALT